MATSDPRTRSPSTEQAWNSFRARVAERSPGHRGGETVLPGAPPLTRLAICPGAVWPGLSNSMPGPKRVAKRNSYILGREHYLAGRTAASTLLGSAEARLYAGPCREPTG